MGALREAPRSRERLDQRRVHFSLPCVHLFVRIGPRAVSPKVRTYIGAMRFDSTALRLMRIERNSNQTYQEEYVQIEG